MHPVSNAINIRVGAPRSRAYKSKPAMTVKKASRLRWWSSELSGPSEWTAASQRQAVVAVQHVGLGLPDFIFQEKLEIPDLQSLNIGR